LKSARISKARQLDVPTCSNVLQHARAGGTLARVTWTVQHYIPLAGAGTLFDPDPTASQPGEFATDGDSNRLPLTSSRPGGRLWAKILIVDDDGAPLPAGAARFDIKIAKRTLEPIAPTTGPVLAPRYGWTGGTTATNSPSGTEVVQDQAEGPTLFVAVITAGTDVPGAGRLAVSTWNEPR